MYSCVHSGRCAPASPTPKPLATISAAMHNGNGRHARTMADLLIQKLGQPRFSWGNKSLTEATEMRTRYIEALRAADSGNITLLMNFVRS